MTYKAYSLGIEQKDFELIRKIIKIITEETPVVKDLTFYDIKLEETKGSVVFLFGKKASILAKDIAAKKILYLPETKDLHHDGGSYHKRKEVFDLLTEFKETVLIEPIKEEVLTLKDPIPEITISDLKILEETLKEKNITKWMTTSVTGKTIQITSTPQEGKTDINITFSELYSLKIAMDVLDIKEFSIIHSNKNI